MFEMFEHPNCFPIFYRLLSAWSLLGVYITHMMLSNGSMIIFIKSVYYPNFKLKTQNFNLSALTQICCEVLQSHFSATEIHI